jgi:hypothetical protein
MTHAQRNEAVLKALQKYTEKNTASKSAAMKSLYDTGIYTKKGELRVEFRTDKKAGASD